MPFFELLNPPSLPASVGLGGNDVLAFYPILALLSCGAFFFTNKDRILGDFFQAEEEFESTSLVEKVGLFALRFPSIISGMTGLYNHAHPEEKNKREEAFVGFVKECYKMSDEGSRGGLFVKTELVSRSSGGSSDPEDMHGSPEEKKLHLETMSNSETRGEEPQTSWWKARYSMTSVFDLVDSPGSASPEKHMPVAFILEGVRSSGEHVRLYGTTSSIVVETDRDVTQTAPMEGLSWRATFDLVDISWVSGAESGRSSESSRYQLVASQHNDKCVFSTLGSSSGQMEETFVSRFVVRLLDKPAALDTDILGLMAHPAFHSELSLHTDSNILLSHALKALPHLDGTIVHTTGETTELKRPYLMIAGVTGDSVLPLEVGISTPDLNDGKRSVYPVQTLMVQYVGTTDTFGDLTTTALPIRSLQMKLQDGRMLVQNTEKPEEWVLDNEALHVDTSINLLMLNRTSVDGKPSGLSMEFPDGDNKGVQLEDFRGIRQGLQTSSVDYFASQKVRAVGDESGASRMEWDDIRTFVDSFNAKEEVDTMQNTVAIVILLSLVVVSVGWFSKASSSMSERIGLLAAGYCGICTVLTLMVIGLESYDRVPERLRPYERILFVMWSLAIGLCLVFMLVSIRVTPEVSPALGICIAIGVSTLVVFRALESKSPVRAAPVVLAFKVGLLTTLALGGAVMGLEVFKYSKKAGYAAASGAAALGGVVGPFPNASMVGLLSVLVFVIGGGLALMYWSRPDKCGPLAAERNRLGYYLSKIKDEFAGWLLDDSAAKNQSYRACIRSQVVPFFEMKVFTDPLWSDFVPVLMCLLVCVGSVLFTAVGQIAGGAFRSRLNAEVRLTEAGPGPRPEERIEDGRTPRGAWLLKTLCGIAIIGLMGRNFLKVSDPSRRETSQVCNEMRTTEQTTRSVYLSGEFHLTEDRKYRMSHIKDLEYQVGCVPQEETALLLIGAGILLVGGLSIVTPARKRFTPTKTSLSGSLAKVWFSSVCAAVLVWSYKEENKTKIFTVV